MRLKTGFTDSDFLGGERAIAAALVVACAVLVTVGAVTAPLLVYSVTLATLGAPHVLSELRYVDRRFGRRIGRSRVAMMGALIAGAVAARSAGVFGLIDTALAVPLELGFVVLLALSAAIDGSPRRRVLAVALASALGVATLIAPFDTAVSLSILHNLTPLAFLWEIAGARRWPIMTAAIAVFVALPLLVASGLPRVALAALGVAVPEADPFNAGALGSHLYVYVPRPLVGSASAVDLFSAAVVAQCAHYAAVILVLPALLAAREPDARGIVRWPSGALFWGGVVAISAAVTLWFTTGFAEARALYGIAASVHAWIEVPLIVIALTATAQDRSRPIESEAALATSETTRA